MAPLYAGQATSLAGDGLHAVALPFLVLDLDNSAGALSLVLLAWSIGLVAFLLVGGIAADRGERRRVLVAADVVRFLAVGAIGLLAVLGEPEPWDVAALGLRLRRRRGVLPARVRGDRARRRGGRRARAGQLAAHVPAPARPPGRRAGARRRPGRRDRPRPDPARRRRDVPVSLACVLAMRVRSRPAGRPGHPLRELVDGWRYVRSQPWLWATLLAAAMALLAFFGPLEVLLPYGRRAQHRPDPQ